ncbi:uncharacterized protein LOC103518133 isoform X2 [Diaphorina citri]|uniref:Uncharacterized protein LOC103518133 isoform X1 n=1 Tax=Diaphorina citri TaxID=121845 RepID=A0A1S3DGV3_DIACI|nr:uncharacterized protein LOC103518133 isoform X1 [Diaphorina citri]XP_026685813.1 uncharacterized protein LOC103518133 isoform X2 [Diaphorina citri]
MMTTRATFVFCASLLILQGISSAAAGGLTGDDQKNLCGVPPCTTELCGVVGPADTICQQIAQSVGATDASCCNKNTCLFTPSGSKCLVAVTKNNTVPSSLGNPAPGSNASSPPGSTGSPAPGTTGAAAPGTPQATGPHYCDTNGLVLISAPADISKVCPSLPNVTDGR